MTKSKGGVQRIIDIIGMIVLVVVVVVGFAVVVVVVVVVTLPLMSPQLFSVFWKDQMDLPFSPTSSEHKNV